MKIKNIVLFIIGVVAIASFVAWRARSSSASAFASASLPVSSGEATVHMTSDGFSPAEIRVKRGTTVHFVNDDTVWHWPASNLHPTHTLYPEFDPKKPVGPGETWSFTFERIGSWGSHDHLAPYIVGKIIVTE